MPKKRKMSDIEDKKSDMTDIVKNAGFFKIQKKTLKEERALIKILKEMLFDELQEDLKEDLKENYTEQDAEIVFNNFIEDARNEGIIKKILKKYLEIKIQEERNAHLGVDTQKTPQKS